MRGVNYVPMSEEIFFIVRPVTADKKFSVTKVSK